MGDMDNNPELNAILNQLDNLTRTESMISNRVNDINTISQKTKEKLFVILDKIRQIKEKFGEKIKTISELQITNKELSDSLNSIKGSQTENQTQIEKNLEEKLTLLDEIQAKNDELQRQLNNTNVELNDKNDELESLKVKKEEENTNISSEFESKISELEEKISELTNVNERLNEKLNENIRSQEDLKDETRQLQAQFNSKNEALQSQLNSEKETLQEQLKNCNDSVEDIFNKLKEISGEQGETAIQNVISKLSEKFKNVSTDIQEKQEQISQLETKNESEKKSCDERMKQNLGLISEKIKQQEQLISQLLDSIKDPELEEMAESIEREIDEILNLSSDNSLGQEQGEQGRRLIPSLNLSQIPTNTNQEVLYNRYNELPSAITNVEPSSQSENLLPSVNTQQAVNTVFENAINETNKTKKFIKDREYASDLNILIDILFERSDKLETPKFKTFKDDINKLINNVQDNYILNDNPGTLKDLIINDNDLYNELVGFINDTSSIEPAGDFDYIKSLIPPETPISGGKHRSKTHKRKRVHFKTRGKGKKGGKKGGKKSKKRKGKHSKTKSN
jgi:chromosome segregation ATPase